MHNQTGLMGLGMVNCSGARGIAQAIAHAGEPIQVCLAIRVIKYPTFRLPSGMPRVSDARGGAGEVACRKQVDFSTNCVAAMSFAWPVFTWSARG
jgi:hypothetical protein